MGEHGLFPFMHEWLSDVDVSLAENLRRWADNEVMAKRLELREDYGQLLEPALKKLFLDIGLQRLLWPEKYGGDGHNSPDVAYTMAAGLEQIARADTGIALLLSGTWALQSCVAMEDGLNKEVCEALSGLFSDKKKPAVVSLILPLYRDMPQASAKLQKGSWVIEAKGARPMACGADAAVFGVLCSLEDSGEEAGLMVVPGDAKGIKRGKPFLKTGLAASRNADIDLGKVKVPENHCVAMGREACRAMLSWLYLGISASNVGALFASYEILKEWGDNRVIKGKGQVFKDNPLTAGVMADVAKEVSLSRMLTFNLARVLAQPSVYGDAGYEGGYVTAGMVAHHVSQAAEKAIGGAMEMMGSAGYAREWNLERYWRDSKTMQLCLGPYELAKMDVARYFYQSRAV